MSKNKVERAAGAEVWDAPGSEDFGGSQVDPEIQEVDDPPATEATPPVEVEPAPVADEPVAPVEPVAAEPEPVDAGPAPVAPEGEPVAPPEKSETEMLREANAALLAKVNELAGMIGGGIQQPAPQQQPPQHPYYTGPQQVQPRPQQWTPEQMAAIQRQQIPPQQAPAPVEISDAEYDAAFKSPEAFQAIIGKITAQQAQAHRAALMAEASEIINRQVASRVTEYQASVEFYQMNPDLRGSENIVAHIAANVNATNPGMPLPQLMQTVAQATRNELKRYQVAQAQAAAPASPQNPVQPRRPAFAGGTAGGGNKPANPRAGWTQEQLDNAAVFELI